MKRESRLPAATSGLRISGKPRSVTPTASCVLPTLADEAARKSKKTDSGNRSDLRWHGSHWQNSLKNAFRDVGQLLHMIGLTPEQVDCDATSDFPMLVTREYAGRIRPGDPNDPLLRQVLPSAQERELVAGFSSDPVGDLQASEGGGMLHKYTGRALMISTGACAIHCRYCFRREFPYQSQHAGQDAFASAVRYLGEQESIEEVILSGGDPLTLTDVRFFRLLDRLEEIPHLTRLRIHSRIPVVLPSRVTAEWVERLRSSRLTPWMVIHSNHAREIDEEVADRIARLVDGGIPVLNQTVLLRGINDNVDVLEALSRRLLECRVIPYYLHQLDRAKGTAHFEVQPERGLQLIGQLESRLPGFAVPRYVKEIAGQPNKTRL